MGWCFRSPRGTSVHRLLRRVLPVAIALLSIPALTSVAAVPVSSSPALTATHAALAVSPLAAATASLESGLGPAAGAKASCVSSSLTSATCSALAPRPSANANENWVHLTGVGGPTPRWISMMAYDPLDGYAVLFGGIPPTASSTYSFAETWVYSSGAWTNLTANLTNAPVGRYAASMAWDAKDGYVLLFGGHQSAVGSIYNDTWEFVHGMWTPLSPTTAPSPRWRAAMAYDVNDGYMLLFGGSGASNTSTILIFNDTWTFTGGQWTNITNITTGHPVARFRGNMAYDALDKYAVLFGGCTTVACSSATSDTWLYSNHTWTDKTSSLSTHPALRVYYGFIWDSEAQAAVLFGGATSTGAGPLSDTWTFSGGAWTSLSLATHPAARGYFGFADDTADGYVLLFSGTDYTTYYNDTWSFGPALVTGLRAAPATLDQGQNLTVGSSAWPVLTSYTYSYAGLPTGCTSANTTTISCAPSTPANYSIEGFVNTSTGSSYTRNVSVTVNADPQIASFVAAPAAVTLGTWTNFTVVAASGTAPLTYSYAGLPSGCGSANRTVIACRSAVAGTFTITSVVSDSVGVQVKANATFVVNARPLVTGFTVSRPFLDVGQRITFHANETGGTPPIHYAYTGLPTGCASVDSNTLVCTPSGPGTFHVTVNASEVFGYFSQLSVPVSVSADPSVTGFTAAPSTIDVGVTTTFNFTIANGTGTFTYAYHGLPAGCPLAGPSGQSCVPTTPGQYTIVVSVTDGAGFTVNASVLLTVNAAPSVASFSATPTVVDTGQNVTFLVTVTGGTLPIAYSYALLPTGCVPPTSGSFVCRPNSAGTFATVVTVSDAFHTTAQGSATVIVHSAPAVSTFTVTPATLLLGDTATLTASVAGGTGGLTFLYMGLPTGCASQNQSSLTCRPSAVGTYTVTVNVTDQLGVSAHATATIVVTAVPSTGGSGGGSLLANPLVLIGIVVAVVAILAIALLAMRRRGRGAPAPPDPSEASPEWSEESPADET